MNLCSGQKPEVLAPAGTEESLVAAIENGADAVYFGLDHGFNARARAGNFDVQRLPEVMSRLHRHGVAGYVTLNTLVFSDELPAMAQTIASVAQAGVDAVLVQDLGVVRMIKAVAPDLAIHASTQMTLTSGETINAIRDLGVERVVLARELSLDEIRHIRQSTEMPLEVFVHGALCVAYSGQCLTSESLGGRSANRGQCAQACRLPYDLICDGQDVELDKVRYLLSPQDLAAFDVIPQLIELGICSFKIEGRLKTPEYVANITSHYRRAVDEAWAGQPHQFSPQEVREMELSFSRGFSHGWLEGCDHKMLVPGTSSAKRGVVAGQVLQVSGDRVKVRLACPLAAGDGVVFETQRERLEEQGGRVFQVWSRGKPVKGSVDGGDVELKFDAQHLDLSQLRRGQMIWKTDDPRLTKRWRKTFSGPDSRRRLPVDIRVEAAVGQTLRIHAVTKTGIEVDLQSADPMPQARKHPLTVEVLTEQLGRLGATSFVLANMQAEIRGEPMIPLSVLGKLRHQLIAELEAKIDQPTPASIDVERWQTMLPASPSPDEHEARPPELIPLCRNLAQLEAVGQCGVSEVYADMQDIRDYRQAVSLAQASGLRLWLAPTRVQKPKEMGLIRKVASYGAHGLLVRNLASMQYCQDIGLPFVTDFSLNATNELSVDYLLGRGAEHVTASYDLNRDQLLLLVSRVQAAKLEVVVHQHMPMFHMEHCVFCSLLSPGTNKTNCGRPCDLHEVKMRDRVGREHLLQADVACRNTLYNATPQSAAEAVTGLLERGVRRFRVELLEQSAAQTRGVLELYAQLLKRDISGAEVWQKLKASNRVGVTRGTLEEPRNPLAIL